MNMKKTLSFLFSFCFLTSLYAADLNPIGFTKATIHLSPTNQYPALSKPTKTVRLLKFKLSRQAKAELKHRLKVLKRQKNKPRFAMLKSAKRKKRPVRFKISMHGAPVLDQGTHGSCVTFANAAVLNAILGKGDYVSELCALQLGRTLEKQDPDYPNGWDGSFGNIVYQQFLKYGIVPKSNQRAFGCGGLKRYPKRSSNIGKPMSIAAYEQISEPINHRVKMKVLLRFKDAFNRNKRASKRKLNLVKRSLLNGYYVSFGMLLDEYVGDAGAVGRHRKPKDTWMLNKAIKTDLRNGFVDAGHEMVIIGYNDNAVVKAADGSKNKGVFILRNSWGKRAGFKGTYYMSYDYFKVFVDEIYRLKGI